MRAQRFLEGPNPWEQPAFILLDEIDHHLHPAWQRQVVPMAQKMFPGAQFFFSTHSPFLISSLNEGFIHHLKMSPDWSVKVQKPTKTSPGDSCVTTVYELMGIPWYDPETEAEIQKFHIARDAGERQSELKPSKARHDHPKFLMMKKLHHAESVFADDPMRGQLIQQGINVIGSNFYIHRFTRWQPDFQS